MCYDRFSNLSSNFSVLANAEGGSIMLKRRSLLLMLLILIFPVTVSIAGTLIEDFNDGNAEGWVRSPQNENNKNVVWEVKDGAFMFDPKGQQWNVAICQMNFVGTEAVTNVREWTDYEFEAEIKHTEKANWPGGIRARVDLDSGGHYVVWLYPGDSIIRLYKNPGWDINAGIVTLGEAPYKPAINEFHKVKIICSGQNIEVYYDDDRKITAKDGDHKKGTIALCVQDKIVYYDNIKVTGPQIPNVKLSPVEPVGKLTITWGTIKIQ